MYIRKYIYVYMYMSMNMYNKYVYLCIYYSCVLYDSQHRNKFWFYVVLLCQKASAVYPPEKNGASEDMLTAKTY